MAANKYIAAMGRSYTHGQITHARRLGLCEHRQALAKWPWFCQTDSWNHILSLPPSCNRERGNDFILLNALENIVLREFK